MAEISKAIALILMAALVLMAGADDHDKEIRVRKHKGQTEKTCTGDIELKDCYDGDCSQVCQALDGVDATGKCAGPPGAECQCTFLCIQ
ncbi:hypothetical protein GQ457_14G011460 [Hibiscus cannabinus]